MSIELWWNDSDRWKRRNWRITLHSVTFSNKENELGGTCGTHRRGEESIQGLVGKPKGKRPLARLRRRWDRIRTDLTQIGWGGVEWIQMASFCEYGDGPEDSGAQALAT
jgi:hypothetical protein